MDALDQFLEAKPQAVSQGTLDAFLDSPDKPAGMMEDVVRGGASGVARALPYAIDIPAAALATGIEKLTGSQGSAMDLFRQNLSNGINPQASKVLGNEYEPQTEAGMIAKGAGGVVGALPLGGLTGLTEGIIPAVGTVGRAAASGAVGTVGSQVGGGIGQAVGGDTGELIGNLVGGAAGGYAGAKTPEILRKPVVNPATSLVADIKHGFNNGAIPLKTADDFKAVASQSFKKAEELGGSLSPNITNKFIEDATNTLVPQTSEGKIVAGNSHATELAERIKGLQDQPISLRGAQEIDEHLSDVMDDMVDPKTGHLTKQGYKVSQLQSALRNSIDAAPEAEVTGGKVGFEAVKEGRRNWAIQARLNDIERIVNRAEMMDNPATGIKTGFRILASNKVKMRGYPDEVQNMIRKSAESGIVEDALKVGGSRLWTMVGSHFGAPGAAAGYFGSALSRSGAERIKMGQAENIAAAISGQKRPTLGVKTGNMAASLVNKLGAPDPRAKPVRIDIPGPDGIIRRRP